MLFKMGILCVFFLKDFHFSFWSTVLSDQPWLQNRHVFFGRTPGAAKTQGLRDGIPNNEVPLALEGCDELKDLQQIAVDVDAAGPLGCVLKKGKRIGFWL